jgi:hypothetical protein
MYDFGHTAEKKMDITDTRKKVQAQRNAVSRVPRSTLIVTNTKGIIVALADLRANAKKRSALRAQAWMETMWVGRCHSLFPIFCSIFSRKNRAEKGMKADSMQHKHNSFMVIPTYR